MTTQNKHLAGDRVLSVRQAVSYIDKHFWAREHSCRPHLMGEWKVRRCLNHGYWPSTHTASGSLGITVRDLRRVMA